MKKRLFSIMAVFMAMLMLVSCGSETSNNTGGGAENIVKSFLDDFTRSSLKECSYYFVLNDENKQQYDAMEKSADISEFLKSGMKDFSKYISNSLFDDIKSLAMQKMYSYSISSVNQLTPDSAEVQVAYKAVDQSSVTNDINLDLTELGKECFGFDMTDSQELFAAYLNKENITRDQFVEKYPNKTGEELYQIFYDDFKPEMLDYFGKIFDEQYANAQFTTMNLAFEVLKQEDGSWKINSVKQYK